MTDWNWLGHVADDLDRVLANKAAPDERHEDGTVVWMIGGRRWTARPFRDPRGQWQRPEAPGIYVDEAEQLHFNLGDLCKLVELEVNPANEEVVAKILLAAVREVGATTQFRGFNPPLGHDVGRWQP